MAAHFSGSTVYLNRSVTCGFSRSYSQAAPVPSSKVRITLALVSMTHSITIGTVSPFRVSALYPNPSVPRPLLAEKLRALNEGRTDARSSLTYATFCKNFTRLDVGGY